MKWKADEIPLVFPVDVRKTSHVLATAPSFPLVTLTDYANAQAYQCEERDLEVLVVNRENWVCLHLQERKRGAFRTTLTGSHLLP
jgi:hypothetical protein